MARPRKDSVAERLTAQLTVQLTATDRAALDEAATEIGQTASDFVRSWVLKGIQATAAARAQIMAQREIDRQSADDLATCGQDLNALAKRANETQEIADVAAIRDVVQRVLRLLDPIDALPKGTVKASAERLKLINEVTRVGNNFMQLGSVARSRQAADVIAVLNAGNDRIIACYGRMMS